MTESVGAVLAREPYDAVIVVGDTVSGLAGALAGAYQDVPVAHVEAGLRTHGREPWPEEMTRKAIDAVAHWHFAPTLRARANLLRENVCHERIYLTGNTVVDSLKRLGVQRKRFSDRTVLVTLHRRENWDTMNLRAAVVRKLAEQHPAVWFIWPVHPNQIVFNAATTHCGGAANINLCDPMAYDEFLDCLASATLVITDSGGVQEEAAVLGVPTLVVRQNTERPEAIEAGVSRLLVDGNLFDSAHDLLSHPDQLEAMNRPSDCFGDGLAGERIADILLTGQTPLGEPCSA
jgi:UDP-N-acetylglucosamine 2-epimerase